MVDWDDMKLPPLEEVLGRDKEGGSADNGGLGSVNLPPVGEILEAYDEGGIQKDSFEKSRYNEMQEDIRNHQYELKNTPHCSRVKRSADYKYKADAKYATGDYEEALVYYEFARDFIPDFTDCHIRVARVCDKLGNKEEARISRNWAKKLDPYEMGHSITVEELHQSESDARRIFGRGRGAFRGD